MSSIPHDIPPQTLKEFGTPRDNEERRDGGCAVAFDPISQKYAVGKDEVGGLLRLYSGGVDQDEDMEAGTLRELTEESGLHEFLHVEKIDEVLTHYRNQLKNVNRVAKATCFLVILRSADLVPVKHEEHEKFNLIWVSSQEILDNWNARNQKRDYDHWIYFLKKSVARAKELGFDTTSI
ncbi:MAG: NUDIX hydrolase [Candidatus Levybacteria bacterium]|nr:NUDIX hydrolase [Candidatus Levybacteria bacterium]